MLRRTSTLEHLSQETTFECSACGSPVPGNAEKCPFCGGDFSDSTDEKTTSLNGLTLALCFILIIFIPVTHLINILLALDNRTFYDVNIMSEMRIFMIQNLVYWAATGTFSLIAGINLFLIKKRAVLIGKIFFFFYLIFVAVKLSLFYFTFYFSYEIYLTFLPNILFGLSGFLYLQFSKSINKTFM